MLKLLIPLLLLSGSAFAKQEVLADWVALESVRDTIANTGNQYPTIDDSRHVHEAVVRDTETNAIAWNKSFTLVAVTVGAGMPDPNAFVPVELTCNPYHGTSKKEVIGLLDRWVNLYADNASKQTVFNNVGSMFTDVESLRIRINALKILLNGCPAQ